MDQAETENLDDDDDEELVRFNSASKRDFVSLGEQILHGGKNLLNGSNRWYDKTMQFIIGTDGLFGLNYEHSPAEAIAVIQLIEHLFKYMFVIVFVLATFTANLILLLLCREEKSRERFRRSKSLCELPSPHRLKWNLSHLMIENISMTKKQLQT